MSRFYENQFKKVALLLVMLLLGTSGLMAQALTNSGPVCAGGSLTLTFNPGSCTGITSVTFNGPYGTLPIIDNTSPYSVTLPGMTVLNAGLYTATVAGGSCNGNVYNTTVSVLTSAPPKPSIAGAPKACVDEVTTYTTPIIPGEVYTWSTSSPLHALVVGGGQNAGVDFVSVQWLAGAVGNSSWVRVTAANACGGTQSDIFFVNVYNNPIPPSISPNLSYYCHGTDGVDLTVSNIQVANEYRLFTYPGDILVDVITATTTNPIVFEDVKVDLHSSTAQQETEFRVVAVNPNVCFAQSNIVKVIKYAEPAVLFSVNDVNASTGTHYEFCYDEEVTVKLSQILVGPAPFQSVKWSVNGDPNHALSGSLTNVSAGDILFGPATIAAGTYTVTLTELKDANGCEPSDYSIYYFTIEIFEEPEMEFLVNGDPAFGETFEFCFSDVIELEYNGTAGVENWDFTFTIDKVGGGPGYPFNGTGWCDDAGDIELFDADVFPLGIGTFTLTITSITDGNGCETSASTLADYVTTIIVHPEPAVGFSFNGDLAGTGDSFEYCYDDIVTVSLSDIWSGDAPFTVDWMVDNGIAPVTYTFTGGLNDNLWNAVYPAGTYTITVTSIVDANGCSPDDYSPWLAYLTINPEPAVGFSFNGNLAATGSEFEYCYDETVTVTLSHIWSGTAPFDISWTVNGVPATATNVFITDELFSNVLTPDTYVVQITSIVDAEGCSPSTYVPYTATAIVHPEPELEVKVDGDIAHGADLDFCFDDVIEITMAGTVGTAPWTVGWSVTGPMNFSDVMSGVSGTWTYDLTDFLPGTYTLTITSLVDDKGCVATQATLDSYEFNIIIHQEPVVNEIDMIYSLVDDLSSPSSISGDLGTGYELCINENEQYYYLGVSSLDADDDLDDNFLNAFYLDITNLPADFYTWWAAKGVISGAAGWQGHMYEIITGAEPQFYLDFDGTDYMLVDGLYKDFFNQTVHLKVNGDYPQGLYTYTGSVKSDNGCFSDVEVDIYFRHDPNADAGDDPLCVTEATYTLDAEYSVVGSSGEWTQTGGPGTAIFASTTSPTSTVTVDVAGKYTFTWTETNGICVDSDEVEVTFLKGTIADATNIDPISDIYTIAGTAAVIYSKTVYGNTSTSDANINVDALIKYDGVGNFPAGAEIIKVNYKVNPMPNFITLPVVNGNIGDKEEFLLSWVLGQVDPLTLYSNRTIEWEIFVDGVSDPMTIPMSINAVTYIGTYTNTCYAVLDEETFDIIGNTATNTLTGTYTACYPDDDLVVNAEIVYPQINVDNRVKADALLKTDKAFNIGATIAVKYNGNPAATYTVTGLPLVQIYLSELLGSTPTPLAGHDGITDNWEFTISDLYPGTYNITVEAMARLDLETGPPTTYNDYVYDTDNAKLIVVGALGVNVDAGDDIETVTGAPVIFEVEVAYGDLASQNIDPSVLVDALIEFDAPTPAGAYIVELLYNGSPVTLANDDIGGITSTLLSSLIGSGPYALDPHDQLTDVWTLTIAGVDVAGTVTATIKSIAYVDYNVCHSVMAEDEIVVTWADLVTSSTTPDIICEGEVAEFTVTITYPEITANNPAEILTDASLQVDYEIDAGVELEWSYNGSPYSKYTFTSALPALQIIKLSEIINNSVPAPLLTAPTPLAGHDGLTVVWSLKITGLDRVGIASPVYNLFIVPIATLDGEDYDLEQVTPLTEIPITVFKAIDPTIDGPLQVFSGAVEEYEVEEPMDYLPTYPTYSWSADPALAVSISNPSARVVSLTFIWDDPLPYDEVDLTVVINDGVCVASETITIDILENRMIGQLKYYNSQNSPMPSPYPAQTPLGEITDYFYVSLVSSSFDVEVQSPYGGFKNGGVIETQKIETVYPDMEAPDKSDFFLEAAFMFDYNINPNAEYRIVVWDGGFFEEDPNWVGSPQLLYSWTWNNWNSEGKINAGDALMIMHMAVNNQVNAFPNMCHIGANNATPVKYGFYAQDVANVNASGGPNPITSLDALLTMRRSLGLIPNWPTSPQYRKPNFAVMGIMDELDVNDLMDGDFSAFDVNYWCTTLPEIEFTKRGELYKASTLAEDHNYYTDRTEFGTGWKYFNIFYNNVGDVRSRTVPNLNLWKAAPAMELNYTDVIVAGKGTEVTIPVSLDQFADLGAMSIGLTYRKDLIEVIATSYGQDNAMINHEEGSVRLGWASLDGQQFEADAPVVLLTVRVLADIDASVRLFELTGYTELVDRNLNTVEGVNFKSFSLTTDAAQATGSFAATNYPNPFNAQTTISYTLPEAGNVSLIIYNKMGQVVKTMVKDYQNAGLHQVMVNSTDLNGPGVYYYKLEVKGGSSDYSSSNSMILIR